MRSRIEELQGLDREASDAREMLALLEAEPDSDLIAELASDLDRLSRRVDRKELDVLFSDPYADGAALLSLSAGAGGIDAQDWAEILMQMYLRWAQHRGLKAEVLEATPGEEAGIKGATLAITG